MFIPSFIFLLITLISGAGAALTYGAYRYTPKSIPNNDKTKTKELPKDIEQAISLYIEENLELKKKLAEAEFFFRDLKAAKKLAPDLTENKSEKEEP